MMVISNTSFKYKLGNGTICKLDLISSILVIMYKEVGILKNLDIIINSIASKHNLSKKEIYMFSIAIVQIKD